MIAVSDTSPICYLVLIGEIDLVPQLFSSVVMPETVLAELRHEDAPIMVRNWSFNLPAWIFVMESEFTGAASIGKLQAGERAAILLAESVNADIILLDEKAARLVATSRGMRVTGTLGILSEAAVRGLIDLAAAIEHLRRTNFRYSPAVLKAAFDRLGGRK